MNKARRTALLRISALSVAVAALATACSSNNNASSTGTSTSTTGPSAASSGSAVAASGSELLIGTVGNFSGPSGQPEHLAGLQAWVSSVNASGGIKGRQVKLAVQDDQGDATKSQAAIRQLVGVDHVLAIVSPEAGGTESGWASYVQQQHVAVIGGQSDTPVWFSNPAFFPSGATVLTSLEMQAYAVKAAGKSTFGSVYCAEIAACKQVLPALQGYAKAFQLSMSTSAAIAVSAPSYTAQCLAARQAGAQALIIDASYAAGSRFAPACAQQGYSPVYVIPSGAFDNRYLQVSQVNGAVIEPAGERVEQVGAMEAVIGRAVARRGLVPVVEFEELAGQHVAGVDAGRRVGDSRDLLADADRAQRLDGLRAGVDRGADLAEHRGGLEDFRRDAEGLERVRRGEPGEPAADDCDPAA